MLLGAIFLITIDGTIVLGDFTGDGYTSKSRGNYGLSENAFLLRLELNFFRRPVLFATFTHGRKLNGIDQTKDLRRSAGDLVKLFSRNGNDSMKSL